MTGNNEYDAIGELFRQRLENHRTPVGNNDWDEIERRMGRRKNRAVIWLWRIGTVAAAASVTTLLIFRKPATDEATVMAVSQQTAPQETAAISHEAIPVTAGQEITTIAATYERRTADEFPAQPDTISYIPAITDLEKDTSDTNDTPVNVPENHQELPADEDTPLLAQTGNQISIPDVSPVADYPEENEENGKTKEKWLLAAAFGTGGYTDESFNNSVFNSSADLTPSKSGIAGSNDYAANLSYNIRSFDGMSKEEFRNIRHRPPVSFGVMARKHLGKHGGVESGLVYTYLASQFEWSGYDVHQGLHYMGVPVNMFVYPVNNAKSNWRVYLSGGFTAEKNLRAVFRQEMRWSEGIRTTTVKSAAGGLQWSLNGALGVSYKLEKGWGIYFEPRVGYSFDCGQPISIRTEWPVYVGINLGLNYEL